MLPMMSTVGHAETPNGQETVSGNTVSQNAAPVALTSVQGGVSENNAEEVKYIRNYPLIDYKPDELGDMPVCNAFLPDEYSSVDEGKTTSVKDQNPYGTCWAFASINAAEAYAVSKLSYSNSLDLSERHLAYFYFNREGLNDPLGNTLGDYVKGNYAADEPAHAYLNYGSNNYFTMWSLANWTGAAEESIAPYEDVLTPLNSELGYRDLLHLQKAYNLPDYDYNDPTKMEAIKQLIMENGALSIAYVDHEYCMQQPAGDTYNYLKLRT